MKKTVIKGLSVMLAVVLTLTAAPLSGFVGLELPKWLDFSIMSKAAETSGTCGENITWTYDEETCTLTIAGTGAMEDYAYSSMAPWYDNYHSSIKTVLISNGITSIGRYAFWSCTNLINITIPDSVTSIGFYTFYNSAYYNDVNNWENDVLYIGNYLIKANTSIEGKYKIKDGTIAIAESAFLSCSNLTSVTIPNGVVSIGRDAFGECFNLANIDIPDSIVSIGDSAFYHCETLTNIVIPNGVTMIGDSTFRKCTNLMSVAIPDSLIEIDNYAFENCENLVDITFPKSLISIGKNAFLGCYSLTNIIIPNSVISIGEKAFYECYKLADITLPNNITKIDNYTFYYCRSLTRIEIPSSITTIGDYVFYECEKLANVTLANSVTSIGKGTFQYCLNLTKIEIPNSVTTIGSSAFDHCINLINITLLDGVTTISSHAFSYCRKLKNITLPDSVTKIDRYAFEYCESLKSITIPDEVTSILSSAFVGCTSLTDVYYSGTEEEWNEITIATGNNPLLNATIHFNYCEHNFVDGTCIECGRKKPITQEMSSQIRFNRNADGSYAETFDVRTRAMISDEDFKSLVGATDSEAIKNIDKIGFVYTINGENFSADSVQAVAQGGIVAGYVDAPVKCVQDAGEYYMFTCLVTDIPATDRNYTLTAYAYICVNGKWYFSEEPMNADFNALYEKNYPIACEKYGWEV